MSKFLFLKNIQTLQDIKKIWSRLISDSQKDKFDFMLEPKLINSFVDDIMQVSKAALEKIYEISPDRRTIKNVLKDFDLLKADLGYAISSLKMLELLIEQNFLKHSLITVIDLLQNFYVDQFVYNQKYAEIFKEFINSNQYTELLKNLPKEFAQETEYLIETQKKFYERNGIWLKGEQRQAVINLKKQIAQLEIEFESHITKDCSTITVQPSQLDGLEEEFISTLAKSAEGGYKLGVDYPTYNAVMQWAHNREVRQALYTLFVNRGFPANSKILQDLVEQRQKLATLLGFESFASLVLSEQMAQSDDTVKSFLIDLFNKAQLKVDNELNLLKSNLPDSVVLSNEGKICPWDFTYLKAQYKKKNLEVNEQEISKYFPFEHVLEQTCKILGNFFDITFQIEKQNLWVKDLPVLTVLDKKNIIGYIILDLFPRQGKYSHACQETFIPSLRNFGTIQDISKEDKENINNLIAATVVVANFTKPTAELPALLSRTDVITFFHELGHALHAIFGKTNYAAFSGTSVKHDFVETPSQVLEELVWNKTILKALSCHYKTNKPLDDEIINKIIKLKHFDSGDWIQRQSFLSMYSLEVFSKIHNVNKLYVDLYKDWRGYLEEYKDDHFYASFGHLTGYSALYYSYLWAKILALDIVNKLNFNQLSKHSIAHGYRTKILEAGGSINPLVLLCNFLGRQPNSDAFFKDLGIEVDEV